MVPARIKLMELTARDRAILDFERCWWMEPGAKEAAVREKFKFSADRYRRLLSTLIDSPAALAYDPLVVKRLQRAREQRRRARFERRSADPRSR